MYKHAYVKVSDYTFLEFRNCFVVGTVTLNKTRIILCLRLSNILGNLMFMFLRK